MFNLNMCKARVYLALRDSSCRVVLAIASIFWFILLGLPEPTFSLPCYAAMGNFMPEHIWATLFGVHGFYSLANNYFRWDSKLSYLIEGVLGAFLWTATSVAILTIPTHAVQALVAPNIALTLVSLWNLVILPIREYNARQSK